MSVTKWEIGTDTIDEETGFVGDYYTPYRDGSFALSFCWDMDEDWTILYHKRGEEKSIILKNGLKSLASAKRYFTQNVNSLKSKVDFIIYDESEEE